MPRLSAHGTGRQRVKGMPVDKRICLSQELFHFDNLNRVSQMKCRHLIQYVVKVFALCMFSCYEIY